MYVDLTKEITVCPYCGEVLFLAQDEYYCADRQKAFYTITGREKEEKKQ